jgi:chemotaxis protein methyltransferase CheR
MAFTYFFRDMLTLEKIRDHVLPALRTRGTIHIWDAGCAMGPEPYSLAIVLRENMGRMIFRNVKIHATDIDEGNQFEEIIRSGRYPLEQIKRIPGSILKRYFQEEAAGAQYRIVPEIRKVVSFRRHDLLSLSPIRSGLGLVLCKNVLLHFKAEERVNVIRMFHNALEEGGFLVTEQTQKLPPEVDALFEQVVSNAQVFKKAA